MLVLDGKIAAAAVKATLLEQTQALKAAGKRMPHLAAILVENVERYEAANGSIADMLPVEIPMNFGGPTAQA